MFLLNPQLAASLCFNMFFVASFFMPEKMSKILYSLLWLIEICGAPLGYPKIPSECKCVFWLFGFWILFFFFGVLLLLAGVEATAFL